MSNYPNSVVYKSILGDWRPTSPIAWVEDGVLQGAIRTVRHDFNFSAPSTPGDYRMRLAMNTRSFLNRWLASPLLQWHHFS